MDGVAQKTLFCYFLTIFTLIFAQINSAYAQKAHIYQSEILKYQVSVNGFSLGDAVISYQPDEKLGSYKLLAKAESQGFAKKLYNIKDTITVNGHIKDNNLQPISHTIVIKENGYYANKSGLFDYSKDLLTVKNNKNKDSWNFVLLDKAKDIFSTMYSLRFNTDLLKDDSNLEFNKTVVFVNKVLKNRITVSQPFNYKIDKKTRISARNVVVESQRIKQYNLKEDVLALINAGKKSALNFASETMKKTDYKKEKNIKIVVSNDERKIPLIIEYSTKFGTFKAVLKCYN